MSKNTIVKLLFASLFIAFVISYVIGMSGYYEYELANKRILTEEKMREFEKAVFFLFSMTHGRRLFIIRLIFRRRGRRWIGFFRFAWGRGIGIFFIDGMTVEKYLLKVITLIFGIQNISFFQNILPPFKSQVIFLYSQKRFQQAFVNSMRGYDPRNQVYVYLSFRGELH